MLVWGWMRCGYGECRASGWYTWLRMSVVHGTSAVGGVCEMCMCLARGDMDGEGRGGG